MFQLKKFRIILGKGIYSDIYILRLSFYLYTVDIQIIFDDSAERIKKSRVT